MFHFYALHETKLFLCVKQKPLLGFNHIFNHIAQHGRGHQEYVEKYDYQII